MKLWQKEVGLDQEVEAFTIGNDPDFDLLLAPHDVIGSLAHAKMLRDVKLVSEEEWQDLRSELQEIFKRVAAGQYVIHPGVEDIHSQVEADLTTVLGDTGKKIHTGRSRNDQILTDLRLYFREAIRMLVEGMEQLARLCLNQSERFKDVLVPGYTHLQAAMPSSFGLWFGAQAENLVDDLTLWKSIYDIINQNPLGSAAGYGTSLPIDRSKTTHYLGFRDLNYNVVHAQAGRGRSEMFMAFGCATTGNTLAKLSMDICLYASQNFGFITLPEKFTTGSSIMPHKKNPDVFELVRARGNALGQLPSQILATTGYLPSGYHRDFQILKESIFPALQNLNISLRITHHGLKQVQVTQDILEDHKYDLIFSVERVNELVRHGTPFREAYQLVVQEMKKGKRMRPDQLTHTHEGSLGNLRNDAIAVKLNTVLKDFDFSYLEKVKQLISE
ncbi:MAG: argininosuccinate lyase [Saprospiraceae bacterium]|nr:argininosuccinate lyase [Saprospiraceae bacterium]